MKLSKDDIKLLKEERERLRDWNAEFGGDLPTTKAMNILRIRDINNTLKDQR